MPSSTSRPLTVIFAPLPGRYTWMIYALMELPGTALGKALYQYVVDYAKKNGYYNVTLHVWSGNDSAEKFYAAQGMKPQFVCLEQIL